jgi:hypothetical protein
MLTKTITSGVTGIREDDAITAAFPSGPGAQPHTDSSPPPGSYAANLETLLPVSRSCSVAGQTQLSAGTIRIQEIATGASVTLVPADQNSGVVYEQAPPAGYVKAGAYSISAAGGAVAFDGILSVGQPIQVQTALAPGTKISFSQPFTINWKGGEPGTTVKVTISSPRGLIKAFDYAYADASAGALTFQPFCAGTVCSFFLPPSNNAEVTVEVAPSSGTSLPAQGISGKVNASWMYRYVFSGLIFN